MKLIDRRFFDEQIDGSNIEIGVFIYGDNSGFKVRTDAKLKKNDIIDIKKVDRLKTVMENYQIATEEELANWCHTDGITALLAS